MHLEDSQKSVTPVQIIWVEHIKLNGFSLFMSPSGQMCVCVFVSSYPTMPCCDLIRSFPTNSINCTPAADPFLIILSQVPNTLVQDRHGMEIVGGIMEP